MKRIVALVLAVLLALGLLGCAKTEKPAETPAADPQILKLAESFAYPSLDVHKEYYGWYTSIYGISETLFRVGDDLSIQPLLAEKAETSEDGLTWTVTLAPKAAFSNGKALTADMVARNLKRLAEVNPRFAYLADFNISAAGDQTLTIVTPQIYPTLLSDLTAPELGIMDLDGTADFDNAPVGTGPFVVKSHVITTELEDAIELEDATELEETGVTFTES